MKKIHVGYCLSSPDTNKHQKNINNKIAPKHSIAIPSPTTATTATTTTTTTPQPPSLQELESDALPTDLHENSSKSNEKNACNTQKSKKRNTFE